MKVFPILDLSRSENERLNRMFTNTRRKVAHLPKRRAQKLAHL